MSDLTDTFWSRALQTCFKNTSSLQTAAYLSIHKTDTSRTEVAGSTRQAITFGTPSSSQMSNSATVSVPTGSSVPSSTEIGWAGIYDASTSGNQMALIPFGVVSEFEAYVSNISSNLFSTGEVHDFTTDDRVCFDSIDGTLPTNVVVGTSYFVLASGLTTTEFKIATTSGGTAIDLTGTSQLGVVVRKFTPIVTNPSSLIDFAAGAIVIGK